MFSTVGDIGALRAENCPLDCPLATCADHKESNFVRVKERNQTRASRVTSGGERMG